MSRYNEVYQCLWDSEDFKSLSKPKPNAQTLWLYLLTGKIRTPLPGIYNIGMGALEDFLKWSRKSLMECFQELSRKDMAKVDLENNIIYLPNWYKWNKPQNPNVLKGWMNLLENIPNCEYKYLYCQQLKSLVEPLGKSFREVLTESFPTPKPEPKPIPGPKPEKKEEGTETDVSAFFEYFLLKTKKQFKLTDDKKALIGKRLKDYNLCDMKKAVDNFVLDDWEGRKDRLDLVYCIGTRNKIDNLEKWINWKTKEEKKIRPTILSHPTCVQYEKDICPDCRGLMIMFLDYGELISFWECQECGKKYEVKEDRLPEDFKKLINESEIRKRK